MADRVVHFEIPFDDGDRARKFYGDVFGWKLMPMPEMSYTIVTTGPTDPEKGPDRAGLHQRRHARARADVPEPRRTSSSRSTNIEDALKDGRRHGGSTVQERRRSATWGSRRTSGTPRATSSGSGRHAPGRGVRRQSASDERQLAAPMTTMRSWLSAVRTISRSTSGRPAGAVRIASAVSTIAPTMRLASTRRSSGVQSCDAGQPRDVGGQLALEEPQLVADRLPHRGQAADPLAGDEEEVRRGAPARCAPGSRPSRR